MTGVDIKLVGANDTIRALNKLEPGLRKRFKDHANDLAMPAIQEARMRYQSAGWGSSKAHGVGNTWAGPAVRGRKVLPWSPVKAMRGVKVRLDTNNRRASVILLQQYDAGTAILETAGRANRNSLGDAMNSAQGREIKQGTSRILGPSLFSKKRQIQAEFEKNMKAVMRRVQQELN